MRRYPLHRPAGAGGLSIYTTTGGGDYPLAVRVSGVKVSTGPSLPPAPTRSKTAAVVMVPPHDPVTTPTGVTTDADLSWDKPSVIRGGRWGMPLAAGLAGLLVGTLLGRWWGGRAEPAGDE